MTAATTPATERPEEVQAAFHVWQMQINPSSTATAICQYIERLEARIHQEREKAGTWQPIETAPKDGTRVLVVAPYGNQVVAHHNETQNRWFGGGFTQYPTHWQPLPTPPALSQEELT